MALFDDIYKNQNLMQDIEDTEILESIEKLGEKKKKDMYDEKENKRKRIINMLMQAAKCIGDSDVNPDDVSIKISIGKDYKLKIKGSNMGVFK